MNSPVGCQPTAGHPAAHTHGNCDICLDDMDVQGYQADTGGRCSFGNSTVRLACGHAYHTDCVKNLLSTGKSECPRCRKSLSDRDIETINDRLNTRFTQRTAGDIAREVAQESRNDTTSRENLGLWRCELAHAEPAVRAAQATTRSSSIYGSASSAVRSEPQSRSRWEASNDFVDALSFRRTGRHRSHRSSPIHSMSYSYGGENAENRSVDILSLLRILNMGVRARSNLYFGLRPESYRSSFSYSCSPSPYGVCHRSGLSLFDSEPLYTVSRMSYAGRSCGYSAVQPLRSQFVATPLHFLGRFF